MRVVIVGLPDERQRLREQLTPAADVVAEFHTVAAARAAAIAADAMLVAEHPADGEAGRQPLTPRETEVVELLVEGLSNKAIAARLGISDQTVKFHVAAICAKLGAANRTDAVRRAIRRGVIAA